MLLLQSEKSDFEEIGQPPKQLKTKEMTEAWTDTYEEEYIH